MENTQSITTTKAGLRYGLMTALASIVFSLVLQLLSMADSGLQYIGFVIMIIGMVFGMKYYKDWNGGTMSFGQGFGIGALVAAINGVSSSAFAAIYIAFIDNSSIKKAMEKAREDMEKRNMPDDQIDQAMSMTSSMMTPTGIFIIGIISSLIFGAIFALIVAAIMKKEKEQF